MRLEWHRLVAPGVQVGEITTHGLALSRPRRGFESRCRESGTAVRFTLLMGLLFGPGLTIVTVLLMFRGESRVASGLTATFSLVTWYALYTSLFQRRRIVFDPATGTVKLFRGRASCGTLSRSDIVSVDLKPVERTVPGVSLQNPFSLDQLSHLGPPSRGRRRALLGISHRADDHRALPQDPARVHAGLVKGNQRNATRAPGEGA